MGGRGGLPDDAVSAVLFCHPFPHVSTEESSMRPRVPGLARTTPTRLLRLLRDHPGLSWRSGGSATASPTRCG